MTLCSEAYPPPEVKIILTFSFSRLMLAPKFISLHPYTRLAARQWMAGWVALVMLVAALVTPWGFARSHGAAAISGLPDVHQAETRDSGVSHGHSHEDDAPASSVEHAHHAGDHSHDNAHAVPVALPRLNVATAHWRERPASAGPWPSLDGLERPPRS